MTLLAAERSRIGAPLADDGWGVYDLPPVCQHPDCNIRWSLEPHHIVRRSELAGPRRWVSIDGMVVPNVVHLCWMHHLDVTGEVGGHRAIIWKPDPAHVTAALYSTPWLWYSRLSMIPAPPLHVLSVKAGEFGLVGPLKEVIHR